ncbi:MAG: carboxypeptidase M32 [Syntrophobacteraceae bacterium]|jgi:carboxypeptidase Taq
MKQEEAYRWLLDYSRETALYESMMSLLGWDQRTCIPKGGHWLRAQQIAALTALLHQRATDPRFAEMLARAEASETPRGELSDEAVNLREWRRNYDRAVKIPEALAVELAKAASEGELAWQHMRGENDWRGFLAFLDNIIRLKRQEASALSSGGEIYDGLIEGFEPGENAGDIQVLFDKLACSTFQLLKQIEASPRRPDLTALHGDSPISAQKSFVREVIACLGYDFDAGRIDRSAHPFTSKIGPGDVRITTRFDPASFVMALFSSIHETGHALYEQGLEVQRWGAPLGCPISMAIHESQSRMWENMVGKSPGFWKHFYPAASKRFAWLREIDIDKFLFALNEVRPSLIRTEADEVTYNLHIIMRFELERMLIGGELEPEDLPEAWNAKMQKYFGLVPPNYSDGVMQDIHWSAGAFGYFPSYALGNMYAAQFYAKAERQLGNLQEIFEAGEFAHFLGWLREHIHSQGSRHLPRALVKAVTAEDLNPDYLTSYLRQKYARLYEL